MHQKDAEEKANSVAATIQVRNPTSVMSKCMNYTSGRESLPLLGEKLWFIEFVSKKNIGTPINGVYCDGRSPLCCLSFLFWGSLGSAVGKDDVHRNARRRPRRSVDPDQTSFRSNLIRVYTAQAHLTEK